MSTSSAIAVVIIVGVVATACAGFKCTIPTSTVDEGCVQCFSYSIDNVETGEFDEITIPPTKEKCKEHLLSIWGAYVQRLNDATMVKLCALVGLPPTTKRVPKTKKACFVNPKAVYSDCIASNDTIFVVKTPKVTGSDEYPPNIVCFLNTPNPGTNEKIYVDTLKMDIEGNPSTSCPDKLIIIKSDTQYYDRVACGTANQPVFYNELINNRVDPFFVSNNEVQGSGTEILFVYYEQPTKRKRSVTSNSTTGEAAIDIDAPPKTDNTISPVCTCKTLPIPIDQLCSNKSLGNNPYYQKYLSMSSNVTYGFHGYKGCLGAEFFRCDGFPASLTEEECESFTLGMTRAEAELFLVEGDNLWSLVAGKDTPFCDDSVTSTQPNAQEHIQLQDLVCRPTPDKANACSSAKNLILKKVAEYLQTASSVPSFF